MKIAIDIGGVMSKYPSMFRPWMEAMMGSMLSATGIEVHVITDQHDRAKVLAALAMNGFGFIPPGRIHCSDYKTHGELCKAVLCEQLGIDVLIDDFPGYVCTPGKPPLRLLVMPDPNHPYYADDWQTDGSEGDFGRRTNPVKNSKGVVGK